MVEISEGLRELLIRQGLDAGRRQADRVNEKPGAATNGAHRQSLVDAQREVDERRPAAGGGGKPADLKTKMRKATGRMTRNRAAFLILVVSND